jgi:hypothetical protein
MMRIIPRGPDTYLFRDGSHASVGWLRGPTVRFTGFPSPVHAIAAAVQGTLAVTAYVRGTTLHAGPAIARPPDGAARRPAVAGESGAVWLTHERGHEWIVINGNAVARLVSPLDRDALPQVEEPMACGGRDARVSACDAGAFSVEFVLSANVSVDARLTLAQVLYAAVRHLRTPSAVRSTTPHTRRAGTDPVGA